MTDSRKDKNERQRRSWRRRKAGVGSIRLTEPIDSGHGTSVGLVFFNEVNLEDLLRGKGLLSPFAELDRKALRALFEQALREGKLRIQII